MKKTTLHILFATFILLGVLISCKSAWYTTCKVEKDEMIGHSRIIETNWGHLTTDRKYGYRLFKFKYDDGKLSLTLGVTSETYFSVSSGMRIDFLLEDGTIVSGIRTESGSGFGMSDDESDEYWITTRYEGDFSFLDRGISVSKIRVETNHGLQIIKMQGPEKDNIIKGFVNVQNALLYKKPKMDRTWP